MLTPEEVRVWISQGCVFFLLPKTMASLRYYLCAPIVYVQQFLPIVLCTYGFTRILPMCTHCSYIQARHVLSTLSKHAGCLHDRCRCCHYLISQKGNSYACVSTSKNQCVDKLMHAFMATIVDTHDAVTYCNLSCWSHTYSMQKQCPHFQTFSLQHLATCMRLLFIPSQFSLMWVTKHHM